MSHLLETGEDRRTSNNCCHPRNAAERRGKPAAAGIAPPGQEDIPELETRAGPQQSVSESARARTERSDRASWIRQLVLGFQAFVQVAVATRLARECQDAFVAQSRAASSSIRSKRT